MEARYQEHSNGVEGGEHHEKKPMLNKMKDKMKKMKDTISRKAHGHHGEDDHEHENEHENEHDNDVMSEEEEVYEEVEEEREADPEVHAAPMEESGAARHFAGAGGRDENSGLQKVTSGEAMATTAVEDPSGTKENRLIGTNAASDESQLLYPSTATGTAADEGRNLVRDRDENIDPQKVDLRAMAGSVEEDHSSPKAKTGTPAAATQLSYPSHPSPAGGDEVGESPLLSSFQAMAVSDKPKDAEGILESPPIGMHDEFSPDKPQQDTPKDGTEEQKSSSYTDKISSTATPLLSSFQETAVSDKPKGDEGVLESPPIGTHDQFSPKKPQQDTPKEGTVSDKTEGAEGVLESPPIGTHDQFSQDKPQQDTHKEGTEEQKGSSYTDKISSTATAAKDAAVSTVYGKASEDGTAIKGKGMTQEEKNDDIKTGQPEKGVLDKGVSVKEYVVGKLRPADEDRALSEVISDSVYTKKQEEAGGTPEGAKGSSEVISDAMDTKKQEATGGTPEGAKGSSEESGSGKGMVEKIKGAVTSLFGAGSTAGAAPGSPTSTTTTDAVAE